MMTSMAEVSYLRLPEIVEDVEQEEDIFAFDSGFPFCSESLSFPSDSNPASLDDHNIQYAGSFDPERYNRIGGGFNVSESGSGFFEDIWDSENQVTFVTDLFQQRVEQSHSLEIGSFEAVPILEREFGRIDRNSEEFGGNSLGLVAEEQLGLGNADLDRGDYENVNFGGVIVSDCEDEFFVCRRDRGSNFGDSLTSARNQSSVDSNLVRFDSDAEEEVDGNDHMNLTLCWDSLQIEDHIDVNDEFEWEEVDGTIEVLNPEADQQASRDLSWEVLLNVNNLGRTSDLEHNEGFYFGGHDDFITTAEYEMTIGQFGGENPSMGRPPASKSTVKDLPSVIVMDEDVQNGNVICVICKDELSVGEQAKQLPCSHRYHGDCIIPWLGIRNTCPVCRHELPTDDPDYEQRRAQRA